MLTAALVLAGLAALLHVYIFWLEALAFDTAGRKAFGVSADDAAVMKPWAYNQGFYNLFLAIVTAVGIVAVIIGATAVGAALVFAGAASMLLAALVLLLSSPDKARAAITQGTLPLLAVILLALGLAL
jgi:putative membrane protein